MPPDVIVAGAGPAGSSTAYHLARRGRRVLMLDRQAFPRDKSCGDGLTRPAVCLLAEMGVLERLRNPQKVAGVRVFMRGRGHRDFLYPAGAVEPGHGLVVPRYELDQAICAQAVAAGAELWEDALVLGITRTDGVVTGVEVRRGAEQFQLRAPVVVAADGAASRLAFQAGLAQDASAQFGFAIRGYYSAIRGLEDLLEIYMPLRDPTDRYILPSYGWVFPAGADSANIGVGIFERGHGVNVRKLMERFLGDLRTRDVRFRHMEPRGSWLGAPLACHFVPERAMVPGLLAVGDAAGLISPFTGEGISYALESGKMAAEAIDRNLREDGRTPDLNDYVAMLERKYIGYFEAGRHSARRYLLIWHALESTFHNEKPLFAICRRAVLFPEGVGEDRISRLLDDVGPLVVRGGLHVREDLLAVGEVLVNIVRRDWPFLARFSAGGRGDPGVPFRPALFLLLAGALRGAERGPLIAAASAIELGYAAALAHLSVEEELPGSAASNGDRPANWGNMLAVIAGDFFLSKAYELSAGIGPEVSRMVADALARVCEGQVGERRHAFRIDMTPEESAGITTRKIATLFELPCRLGAMLGGLPDEEQTAAGEYGRYLGLAFHLADEVLDYSNRASELGRAIRAEPGGGVFSEPLRVALRRPEMGRLRALAASGQAATPEALDLVRQSGSLESCIASALAYARHAQAAVSRLPDGPARLTLWRLADYAVDRETGDSPDLKSLF